MIHDEMARKQDCKTHGGRMEPYLKAANMATSDKYNATTVQALGWILSESTKRTRGEHSSEVGCLFWQEQTGTVIPGSLVDDERQDQVSLYRLNDRVQMINGVRPDGWPKLVGDFHTHPATATFVGQLPSPDDLFSQSAICDHWELNPPIGSITDLAVGPSFHAILLAKYDLLWVIERCDGREQYGNLEAQKLDVAKRRTQYENWHRNADARLGRIDANISTSAMLELLERDRAAIQKLLDGRCEITLISVNERLATNSGDQAKLE
jgi:hypothetical protein